MGKPARVPSIDVLRGFVIALMALDHTRDYFGPAPFDPLDLAATTPLWFWTRWITHLCAPTFVLLAGCSAFLRGQSSGVPALARYLASRGLLLIALEATWISFSWQFAFNVVILQVLWALGCGMILLAALVWLPRPVIALVAALLILPHNLLDGWNSGSVAAMLLHQGGFYPLGPTHGIVIYYPLMPWLGLIAAGYALGPVMLWEPARRRRFLLGAGGLLLLTFVCLRAGNLYGDPDPWTAQGRGWMLDLMAFVRVHKYPPSLLYLCVTLGLGLPLLTLFERIRPPPMLALFGRTPMFFYCVHIALIHLLGIITIALLYRPPPSFVNGRLSFPPGYAPSLALVYLAWVLILLMMYGLTRLWCRRHQRS